MWKETPLCQTVEAAIPSSDPIPQAMQLHIEGCKNCQEYQEACRLLHPLYDDTLTLSQARLQVMIAQAQTALSKLMERRLKMRIIFGAFLALPGVILINTLIGYLGYWMISWLHQTWQTYFLICLFGWILMGLSLSYGSLPIVFDLFRRRREVLYDVG